MTNFEDGNFTDPDEPRDKSQANDNQDNTGEIPPIPIDEHIQPDPEGELREQDQVQPASNVRDISFTYVLALAGLFGIFYFTLALLFSPLRVNDTLLIVAILDVITTLVVAIYWHGMYRDSWKRATTRVQREAVFANEWSPPHISDRIRFWLEEDDEFILETRRSRMYLYSQLVPLVLVGMIVIVPAVLFPSVVPWWAPVIAEVLLGIVGWLISYNWRCRYIVLTHHYLHQGVVWPQWLYFLPAPKVPLRLHMIATAKNMDSIIGNMLGFGSMRIATTLQEGEEKEFGVDIIRWLPNHEEVVRLTSLAASAALQGYNTKTLGS